MLVAVGPVASPSGLMGDPEGTASMRQVKGVVLEHAKCALQVARTFEVLGEGRGRRTRGES